MSSRVETSHLHDLDKVLLCADFFAKKSGRWPLLTPEQFDKIQKSEFVETYRRGHNTRPRVVMTAPPVVRAILEAGEGKAFIAGGAALSLYKYGSTTQASDIDVFIVAQDASEAESVVMNCIHAINAGYGRSTSRPVSFTNSEGAISVVVNLIEVQFIKRVYQSPDQIIGMFDLYPCQIYYGLEGFRMTYAAAFTIATSTNFADPTKMSSTWHHRLIKYHAKDFQPRRTLEDPDSVARRDTQVISVDQMLSTGADGLIRFAFKRLYSNPSEGMSDYAAVDNDLNFRVRFDRRRAATWINLLSKRSFDKMPYTDVSLHEMFNPSVEKFREFLWNLLFATMFPANMKKYSGKLTGFSDAVLGALFGKGNERCDAAKELCATYSVNRDYAKAKELTLAALHALVAECFEKAPMLQPHALKWRVADPGGQASGSFQPRYKSGRDYWIPGTIKLVQVGISHERYLALRLVWRQYVVRKCNGCLMRDLLNKLCYEVLAAENNETELKSKIEAIVGTSLD